MAITTWYLQYRGSGFGPLSLAEIKMVIKSGKMQGPLFAMGPGLEKWTKIENVPQLEDLMNLMKGIETNSFKEKRKSERTELIAVVRFHYKDDPSGSHHLGVCRDLSTGGMMIVTHHLPPKNAAIVELEVQPEEESCVTPFAVNGVVRHMLADKSGYSIEFINLPQKAAQEIQQHINSSKKNKSA